ncbi:phage holin family protein [Bacillus sp. FJAT-27231]|uniref:phage holin family protein n=1 Tax=Bacillus sp. FJAT-27231 TaxID=1679168 RepID=UPI000A6AACDB|nr:phage holin family protein [Bacillus sp. FJAT-27231]
MESLQRICAAFTGALFTPIFESLYGEGEIVHAIMSAVVFFIMMDWISGTWASKKDTSYASKYGIDGLFRTFFILLLPGGGHLLMQHWNCQVFYLVYYHSGSYTT